MIIKYDAEINDNSIRINLQRITNQIYKLLPNREEGIDWEKPLSTLIEELAGMDSLLIDQHDILFPLLYAVCSHFCEFIITSIFFFVNMKAQIFINSLYRQRYEAGEDHNAKA